MSFLMSGFVKTRFGFLLACTLTIGDSTFVAAIVRTHHEPKEIWIGDVLSDDDRITYRGYVIQRKSRTVVDEMAPKPIDISYAVLNRNRKRLMTFDANVYFGAGNSTRFGLIALLGNHTKQAIISQDVYRGGNQWIVALSRQPRVIFDGRIWSVGREGDDLGIVDIDGDGVYEITFPITSFYQLHDKMAMSQIPLPEIVFRYDPKLKTYLPANRRFRNYLLGRTSRLDSLATTDDEFAVRSAILDVVLTRIYAGRESDAWRFYNRTYTLDDKAAIKRRIKSILREQPVYNFIYRRSRRK